MNQTLLSDHTAPVNDIKLFYRTAGSGSPVVLLHGYAQTGHMWNPIIPDLMKHHTVLVPDLRGVGGSEKPCEVPLALVKGRERIYLEHFWNGFAADPKRSVSEADRQIYANAYALDGGMRAGFQGKVITGSGHWLMDEAPQQTIPAIMEFV